MALERRFFKASQVRASQGGKGIAGYAAVFNQLSEDLGGFRERIIPGAFSRCLGSDPDVRCLFNHDSNIILGRTKSGTLELREDRTGLFFDCRLPDTQAGRDIRESVSRGDIDQCSFGFVVQGQTWHDEKDTDGKTRTIRELTDVDLFDVSPVTYAAYPQTSVSAREAVPSALLWPEGRPVEIEARQSTARKSAAPAAAPEARVKNPQYTLRATAPKAPSLPEFKSDAEALAYVNAKLGVSTQRRTYMRHALPMTAIEMAELRTFLISGKFQRRDLTVDTAGGFIPETFNAQIFEAMKQYDEIFDPEVSTVVATDTGSECLFFQIDDCNASAYPLGEGIADAEGDPFLFQVRFPQAKAWDSGLVKVSHRLLQDSAVDVPDMLARAFGIRLARGISASLINFLKAAAFPVPVDQLSPFEGIGYQDLLNLRTSINPAYRRGKCWWLLNDNTLSAIDGIHDFVGHPLIKPEYVNGRRYLMGYPVAICPSLPDIALGSAPLYFGNTGYFVVRRVKGGGALIRFTEAPGLAENLEIGFKSFLRCDGRLLAFNILDESPQIHANPPVAYLQC
jgi:HK97 family phage major capsid protein/HK97 family phage prohead protease